MNKLTDEILKKCPICGSEPMIMCYTSNPPKYGCSHCGIESGCCKSITEAERKWNEQVYLYQQKQNKLTDEQIIKALEHCKVSNCLGCPAHSCIENCLDVLTPNVLEVINRQKAEIDILIRKKETLRDEISKLQNEVETWKRTADYNAKKYAELVRELEGD